jgi:hypothetical protein
MSVTNKMYDPSSGVRRVTITTGPQLHPFSQSLNAAKNYYCLGLDTKGFQYQIDLQALPVGVTIEQIQPNQVWWVEKRTSLYRLYLYAGQFDAATKQVVSTAPLPADPNSPFLTISGGTISGNLVVASGLTVGGNLSVSGTIKGGITSNYFASTLGGNLTMTNANTNYNWLTTSTLASGIWMLNVQTMFYTTSTTAVCVINLGTSAAYSFLGPYESETTTNGNDTTLSLSTIVSVTNASTITLNSRSSAAGVVIYQNGRAFGLGAVTGYTAVRIA